MISTNSEFKFCNYFHHSVSFPAQKRTFNKESCVCFYIKIRISTFLKNTIAHSAPRLRGPFCESVFTFFIVVIPQISPDSTYDRGTVTQPFKKKGLYWKKGLFLDPTITLEGI